MTSGKKALRTLSVSTKFWMKNKFPLYQILQIPLPESIMGKIKIECAWDGLVLGNQIPCIGIPDLPLVSSVTFSKSQDVARSRLLV